MNKRTPSIEWTIAESEAEWERLQEPLLPDSQPATRHRLYLNRYFWSVAAPLLLLASTGSWLWHADQVRAHQAAADAMTTAQQQLEVMAQHDDRSATSPPEDQSASRGLLHIDVREYISPYTAVQTNEPDEQSDIAISTVVFSGIQGIAHVIITPKNGASAYRQTRFYRRTSTAWLQTEPDAALWGPENSLATLYFVYHFRQNDAAAVGAVAAQMDALVRIMRRNFGLSITPDKEKLVIEVSVAQPPGNIFASFYAPDRFIVPSPALYLVPLELTDADLLAQSIAIPLLDYELGQASDQARIRTAWQPMVRGLRLWQLWDLGLPLSAWREEVITWLYVDLPAIPPGQAITPPARYRELCAAHALWMVTPVDISIPLFCASEEWYFSSWGPHDSLVRLHQLAVPISYFEPSDESGQQGQTVALATLVEYAVATYGREHLPQLVAGLGQYDSWDTLLPAVYGVSATEFEAGWQAYLMAHYGVPSLSSGVNLNH